MTMNSELSKPSLTISLAPIAVRIRDAVRMTGICRSKLYELMESGDIQSAKIGTSRLIIVASLQKLIDESRC